MKRSLWTASRRIFSSAIRVCNAESIFGSKKQVQLRPSALLLYSARSALFQKPFRIGSVRGRQRNTDTDGRNDLLFVEVHWRGHRGGQASRKILDLIFVVDISLDHHKLVAAKSGDNIVDSGHRPKAFSDRLEHEIAAVVPEAVIDLLEVIEIDEVDGETSASQREDGKRVLEFLDELSAIGKAGQR